ncbi:MAG: DUF1566 domain-containing protein [Myxococcota bacterium]|nr:DUF1566 domain-containing protein [Myxococcota bacterium]
MEGDADADSGVLDAADDGDGPVDVDRDDDAEGEADAGPFHVCCNGIVEPGEECDSDPPRACTTSCGVTGSQACIGCRWEAECCGSSEVCGNGCDDDCDTLTDEGACGIGTACTDDAACTGAGAVCNENWGICVASSCAGEPDFTPCELITEPSDRAYDICVDEACVSPGCGDARCNAPGPNWTLPDTGQRRCCCHDYSCPPTTDDRCPLMPGTDDCARTPYCGQDGQYGWDVTHAASERFTRTEEEEPIVTDNVTGLVWQGCLAGQTPPACDGFGRGHTWEDALSYCDSLSWGGFSDWGLPDRYQLQSIVDYGLLWGAGGCLDPDAFPGTTHECWSSSSCAESASHAWHVDFIGDKGAVVSYRKAEPGALLVRCVRLTVMSARADSRRFTRTAAVPDQPVVADTATGLVWQGCSAGQSGVECAGSPPHYGWEDAVRYCQALDWGSYTDWYLPNVRELASILDDRRERPSIDTTVFPGEYFPGMFWLSPFWSSSVMTCFDAWHVGFGYGEVGSLPMWYPHAVRCVRCGS